MCLARLQSLAFARAPGQDCPSSIEDISCALVHSGDPTLVPGRIVLFIRGGCSLLRSSPHGLLNMNLRTISCESLCTFSTFFFPHSSPVMAVCDPNLRNMVPKLGIGHESFLQFPPLVSQNDCADVDLSIHFSWEVAVVCFQGCSQTTRQRTKRGCLGRNPQTGLSCH